MQDAVQFGAQQLRRHLFKLPRPPRRHDDASPIEEATAYRCDFGVDTIR
jgi:hypothetical protein